MASPAGASIPWTWSSASCSPAEEKDLDFCGALLAAGVVAADDVRTRAGHVEASPEEIELLLGRVDRLSVGPAT